MEKVFVKNAADEEQVNDSERKEKNKRQKEAADLQSVLSGSAGCRFLWKLLSDCGVFGSVFSANAHEMAFLEGQRNVGLNVLKEVMKLDPDFYIKMIKESQK